MLTRLHKALSFHYDDRPMGDRAYERHIRWIRYLHDYYHRVEHHGYVDECLELARKEHVIFIMNHAIMVEAALLGYFLLVNHAGKMNTLVFREAFKLPLIREFFRSCHCLPISVGTGAEALKKRHVLLFPEGMDFIGSFVNRHRVAPIHRGFLRMAKLYLQQSRKKSVCVVPIGHAGFESALKVWVIRNRTFMEKVVRPFADFPYFVLPKIPFVLPVKVFFQWGIPVRLTLQDLRTERKIAKQTNEFKIALLNQRVRARHDREAALF